MGCVWQSTVGFILYEVLNEMELKLFALSVLSGAQPAGAGKPWSQPFALITQSETSYY